MWAVTTDQEIANLERSGRVVCILLAEQYDQALLDWVYGCWNLLHADSGFNWHIAVPSRKSVSALPGTRVDNLNFNTELSRELLAAYGLKLGQSPCLLFDNFNEEAHQRYVSLRNRDDQDLKGMFRLVAEIIADSPNARARNDIGRARLTDEIVDGLNRRDATRGLLKVAPKIFSFAARFSLTGH
jgi:hypothetical protein